MDNEIKNGDMPAMPITFTDNMVKLMGQPKALTDWSNIFGGMSKLEEFTKAAMLGIISSDYANGSEKLCAEDVGAMALDYAIETLKALEANNGKRI